MTGDCPVFNRCRSLPDRDDVLDLSSSIAIEPRLFRSADGPPRSKIAEQLLLKHPAGLNKQAAIDRLVGHVITLIARMSSLQPAGDLLGRPVQSQLARHGLS